jgi:hypothetical protein
MEWLDVWAQSKSPVSIRLKDDDHIIKQWLGHLKNKYKVAKFVHE